MGKRLYQSIIPEKMKIKLIIVDSFEADYPLIRYFYNEDRMTHFLYSPLTAKGY